MTDGTWQCYCRANLIPLGQNCQACGWDGQDDAEAASLGWRRVYAVQRERDEWKARAEEAEREADLAHARGLRQQELKEKHEKTSRKLESLLVSERLACSAQVDELQMLEARAEKATARAKRLAEALRKCHEAWARVEIHRSAGELQMSMRANDDWQKMRNTVNVAALAAEEGEGGS